MEKLLLEILPFQKVPGFFSFFLSFFKFVQTVNWAPSFLFSLLALSVGT